MVDVAQEAVKSKNYGLATEIYERVIKEKGPASELFVQLGSCLALSGRINEAFTAFLKAYRLGTVKPEELDSLVKSLVKLTRGRMNSVCSAEEDGNGSGTFPLNTAKLLDSEPFLCGLCLGTVMEPTTIYCGHTFCKRCLDKSDHNVCMVCGRNPPTEQYRVNVLLATVVKKLFPNLEELWKLKNMANAKFSDGNFSDAVATYTDILEVAPKDHTIWSNRSCAHCKLKHFDKALEDAIEVINLRPQWAKGYFRRGVAEEALGRSQQAAMSYLKCLALDERAHQAHTHLTQILNDLLKPTLSDQNLKHVPSTSSEPMSQFMLSPDSDENIQTSLENIKALLDQQFNECDTALDFSSCLSSIDTSSMTIDMFECSLCYRLLYQPITTTCGHVFCHHCISRSLDHSTSCPQCRGCLASYLAQKNKCQTVSIEKLLEVWFCEALEERRQQHEEDLAKFSVTGATAEIPIFVCTVAFPRIPCPLHIYEPHYRLMMRQVMEAGIRQFGMCLPAEDGSFADYGTMLEINDIKFYADGRSVVDTVGGRRFRVLERSMKDGYNIAKVEFLDEARMEETEMAELQRSYDAVYEAVISWLSSLPNRYFSKITQQYGKIPDKEEITSARLGPKWMWWTMAILPVDPRAQVAVLSMSSLNDRLTAIQRVLTYISQRS